MPSLSEVLAIIITADGGGAIREFDKVGKAAEKDLGKAETSAQSMASGLMKTGAIMTGVGAVFEVGFYKAAESAGQHENALAKLNNTLENNKRLAGETSAGYEAQAEALSHSTSMSRDDVLTTQALIGQYKTSGAEIQKLTPLIGDMSLKMGKDLPSAAMAVGKALEGNATSLRRMGVMVDENVYKTNRYKAVQEALASTVGGFAAEQGRTFSGQLAIMGHQVQELSQDVGVGSATAFEHMFSGISGVTGALNSLNPSLTAGIGEWGTYAATAAIGAGVIAMVAGGVMKLALTTAQYKAMQAEKTAATAEDTAATQAEAGAEAEAATATEAHAAAAAASTAAQDAEAASASTLAISEMSVVGALSAVTAGAAIAFVAISKIQDASNQKQSDMFGKMDFTDLEGANSKLNETGQKINDLSERWNNYSATEKMTHAFEWKNLQDLIAQQEEYRKHIDAQVEATGKVGTALGMTAKQAESLLQKLKIDPTQVGMDKLIPELIAYQDHGKTAEQVTMDLASGFSTAGDAADTMSGNVDKLNSATFGVIDAQHGYDSSLAKVADAEQAVQDGAQRIVDAQAKVADATQAVADAQQTYRDDLRRVQDAIEKVTDAEQKLQDIQNGGKHGDEYSLGKKEAAVGLEEANKRLADSQKKLQDAKTPADKEQARIDVERAQIEVERAHNAVTDANTKQSEDLKTAQDAVTQAQDGVTQAQRAADKAAQQVAKSEDAVARASGEVRKAQEAEDKAIRGVSTAMYDAAKAYDNLLAKQDAEIAAMGAQAGAIDNLMAKYEDMAANSPAFAAQLPALAVQLSGGVQAPPSAIGGLVSQNPSGGSSQNPNAVMGAAIPGPAFSGGGSSTTVNVHVDGRQVAQAVVPHLPSVQRSGR